MGCRTADGLRQARSERTARKAAALAGRESGVGGKADRDAGYVGGSTQTEICGAVGNSVTGLQVPPFGQVKLASQVTVQR